MKAHDNPFPYLTLAVGEQPPSPLEGQVRLWSDLDGNRYALDSAGAVTALGAGAEKPSGLFRGPWVPTVLGHGYDVHSSQVFDPARAWELKYAVLSDSTTKVSLTFFNAGGSVSAVQYADSTQMTQDPASGRWLITGTVTCPQDVVLAGYTIADEASGEKYFTWGTVPPARSAPQPFDPEYRTNDLVSHNGSVWALGDGYASWPGEEPSPTAHSWTLLVEGVIGEDGASAYQIAVAHGFVGDEAAWLDSLVGPAGADGAGGGTGGGAGGVVAAGNWLPGGRWGMVVEGGDPAEVYPNPGSALAIAPLNVPAPMRVDRLAFAARAYSANVMQRAALYDQTESGFVLAADLGVFGPLPSNDYTIVTLTVDVEIKPTSVVVFRSAPGAIEYAAYRGYLNSGHRLSHVDTQNLGDNGWLGQAGGSAGYSDMDPEDPWLATIEEPSANTISIFKTVAVMARRKAGDTDTPAAGGSTGGGAGASVADLMFRTEVGQYRGPSVFGLSFSSTGYDCWNGSVTPMYVTGETFGEVAVEVVRTGFGTSCVVRLAMYHATEDGGFGDLFHDHGTIQTATSGVQRIALDITPPPGKYWVVMYGGAGSGDAGAVRAGQTASSVPMSPGATIDTAGMPDPNGAFNNPASAYHIATSTLGSLNAGDPALPTLRSPSYRLFSNRIGAMPIITYRRSA